MILYGEDRFRRQARGARAGHLIRTQYPASLPPWFHDSAEEIPLKQLGRVRVAAVHTNTREGLDCGRLLERQKKDSGSRDDHRWQTSAITSGRSRLKECIGSIP